MMSSAEKFCLRWNDFETNISGAFRELREDKDFFDVTLACDDDQIQAHKVILSACSPFFRTILKRNRHEHPLLYLKGVKYADLMAVLNFMYQGEVNVAQDDLNSFLAIAEDLKVKGLTQNNQNSSLLDQTERQGMTAPQPKRGKAVAAPEVRNRTNFLPPYEQDDDVQEVVPIKTEPSNLPIEPQNIQPSQVVDANMENSMGMYDESYTDYDAYEEGAEGTYDGTLGTADNLDGNKALDVAISNSMRMVYDDVTGTKVWQCLHCSKTNKDKTAISRHVESHLEGHAHNCTVCHKSYKTRLSLNVHMTQKHRKIC